MAFNTIILQKGDSTLTRTEYKEFEKMDTIYGDGSNPEELMRWDIKDENLAIEELKKYRCSYTQGEQLMYIEEYALMFCECDDNGEFVLGADFISAEEAFTEDEEFEF